MIFSGLYSRISVPFTATNGIPPPPSASYALRAWASLSISNAW